MSARGRGGRRGRIARRFALLLGLAGCVAAALALLLLSNHFQPPAEGEARRKAWALALVVAVLAGSVVAGVAWFLANDLGQKLTDLVLAIQRVGSKNSDLRIRFGGNDEVGALARGLQYLNEDMNALQARAEVPSAGRDPQVREMRDRALPQHLDEAEGFEVDGSMAAGERGGLDYYGSGKGAGGTILFVVRGEGDGTLGVLAGRMARDELMRALRQGVTARKALAHTNKVLHDALPRGACALASLLELGAEGVKLYQCGARTPLWLCARGVVQELAAEGIALGLDDGPVFEKALRSARIEAAPGVRLVLVNEAVGRDQALRELVREHAPKHTSAFLNLVLGSLGPGDEPPHEDVVLLTAKRMA